MQGPLPRSSTAFRSRRALARVRWSVPRLSRCHNPRVNPQQGIQPLPPFSSGALLDAPGIGGVAFGYVGPLPGLRSIADAMHYLPFLAEMPYLYLVQAAFTVWML